MTYFHMGIHTIIGAKSFHCPVRDGNQDAIRNEIRALKQKAQHEVGLFALWESDDDLLWLWPSRWDLTFANEC